VNIPERLARRVPEPFARLLRRFLPQGQLTRGVFTLVLGTTIAQGIVIVSAPILTRLYSPSDLGAFGVATSVVAILLTVTCLSYDFAIALPEEDSAAANVLALCLLINVAMTVAGGIVVVAIAPALLVGYGVVQVVAWVALLSASQLVGGVAVAMTGWAIRTRAFPDLAAARVTQSAATVAAQVMLGIGAFGALGLLAADLVGRVTAAIRLGRAAWRSHEPSFRRVSLAGVRVAAVRYRRFPIFSTGSALLNTLGLQAPLLLLVALYGAGPGGQFLLAQRVAALPIVLVAGSVGQVFFGEAARLSREHPAALRALFLQATSSLVRWGIGPSVLIAALAPFLFAPLFGEEWRDAGLFAALLAPMYFLALVSSPTGATLGVLERQDLHLARELLRLGLMAGAVLAASALHLSALQAVGVLSVAGCVAYVIYGLVSWWAIAARTPGPPPAPEGTP
jgi:O-antigen/teichoic acid export membrane protein